MKLPLSSPRTSSSPSGYARVISAPSSSTRAAMVASIVDDRLDRLAAGPAQHLRRAQHRHEAPPLLRVAAGRPTGRRPGSSTTRSCAASTGQSPPVPPRHPGVLKAADHQPAARSPPTAGPCLRVPRAGRSADPDWNQAVRPTRSCRCGRGLGPPGDPPFPPESLPAPTRPGPARQPRPAPSPARCAAGRTPARRASRPQRHFPAARSGRSGAASPAPRAPGPWRSPRAAPRPSARCGPGLNHRPRRGRQQRKFRRSSRSRIEPGKEVDRAAPMPPAPGRRGIPAGAASRPPRGGASGSTAADRSGSRTAGGRDRCWPDPPRPAAPVAARSAASVTREKPSSGRTSGPADRPHACEPARPRALEGPHEHRLGLVVGVMRSEDDGGAEPLAEGEQPGIARLAGRRLAGPRSELQPYDLAPKSETSGEGGHPLRRPTHCRDECRDRRAPPRARAGGLAARWRRSRRTTESSPPETATSARPPGSASEVRCARNSSWRSIAGKLTG